MNTEVRPCPSACCVCMNACEHGRDGCDGDAQTEGTAGRLEARKGHSLLRKKSTERLKLSQFSSVAQSCPTLCDPVNHSMPGLSPSATPRVYADSCPLSW